MILSSTIIAKALLSCSKYQTPVFWNSKQSPIHLYLTNMSHIPPEEEKSSIVCVNPVLQEDPKISRRTKRCIQLSSVHSFSHVQLFAPHGPQHARSPCPTPAPRIYPNSCPLSRWQHPTISLSIVPFSSSPQSFPVSGSFQMSQLFASGGRSIDASTSTSVLPMNTQDGPPLGWTSWISLNYKELSRVFSNTTVQQHQFFCAKLSL